MPELDTRSSRAFWERSASRYDLSMTLFGGPLPRMRALVAASVGGSRRVLEVACGTGLVTEAIAPVVESLLAVDYADAMVESTRGRVGHLANVRCERRDLYELGEPAGSFDAVVAANVLHLLPDLAAGLSAMHRALPPGGRLVVPTYCHGETRTARAASWLLTQVSFPVVRRFDQAQLVEAVKAASFSVDHVELLPGLLPITFLSASAR